MLPQEVIHRIAAGEVVDRPASVLKELIENAIDADSTAIRVQIVDGGTQLIEVEDNGCGMSRKDLEIAVQRHATSKIHSVDDLEAIFTLGFRGEALSAISSVTRLEIESRRLEEPHAWLLELVGGLKKPLVPSARTLGTRIRAHDLFFNVPARRKFLKKNSAEAADCVSTLVSLAMSHPEISFEWHVLDAGGELKSQAEYPRQSALERFQALITKKGESFYVHQENPAMGFKSIEIIGLKPPIASSFQKSVHLSVNGRFVSDKRLPFAMREAFQGLIEMGAYPFALVRVEVDPNLIDVNIHPQKKEIRWPSGFSLGGMVYSLVRPLFELKPAVAVEGVPNLIDGTIPAFDFRAPEQTTRALPKSDSDSMLGSALPMGTPSLDTLPSGVGLLNSSQFTQPSEDFQIKLYPEAKPPFSFSSLRVVGEVGAAWIVCEAPVGLVLIDQHAAHERINFERILKQPNLLRIRPLLLPMVVDLPLGVEAQDPQLIETLESLGFELNEFPQKSGTLELIAVPEGDRKVAWNKLLEQIFENSLQGDSSNSMRERLKVTLAASLSCHGSVRRGQRLVHEQIVALLKQMDEVEWGGLCPHGRPLWFQLSHSQIEAAFHR